MVNYRTEIIGHTALGLPIEMWHFAHPSSSKVLILGGVHGDEVEGTAVALALLRALVEGTHYDHSLFLIPRFNADGVLLKTRGNFNGVDLNRNLPTKDWSPEVTQPRYNPGPAPASEPENKALLEIIDKIKPNLIISLHSWYPVLNVNGPCHQVAKILQKHTQYRIDTDIGYPTPGSLGTYAGIERGIPTLTYEIERGAPLNTCVRLHVPALLEVLQLDQLADL